MCSQAGVPIANQGGEDRLNTLHAVIGRCVATRSRATLDADSDSPISKRDQGWSATWRRAGRRFRRLRPALPLRQSVSVFVALPTIFAIALQSIAPPSPVQP